MTNRLLILNGSFSEIPLIKVAKQLGYYVISTGNDPTLIGHSYSDEYIQCDYSDKEGILELVKENSIDRIVSCANDFGVLTACYVAEQLGLPGHDTYNNALTLHHKDLFKTFIQKLDLRCPPSMIFNSREEAIFYLKKTPFPIIVKAIDLTGGKGILKAANYQEGLIAIDNAYLRSRSDSIVIEPYIDGVQQSIDTFIKDRKVIATISNDCYMPINPYLIQSETLPAHNIEQYENELHDAIELICRELDLVDGMFTLQYIVRDGKPYIIEMMRRCLGNQFLTAAYAATGFPWEEALVRAETGMALDRLKWSSPKFKFAGHHGIMATHNGRISGYEIEPSLKKHIFKTIDIMKSGDYINDFMNERVAYIYYGYDNRDEIDNIAKKLNSLAFVKFE